MANSRLFGFVFAVLISVLCSSDVFSQTLIFGPKTYTRVNGARNVFTDTFSLSSLQGTFTLIVENGNANGGGQVMNASLTLNGVEVVTQKDFQKTSRIEKTITLLLNNSLTTQLKGGPPNSFIRVSIVRRIEDHDGPIITIEQPQAGQTLNSSPITVSGKVTDVSGVAELKVNGTIVPVVNDAFTTQLTLTEGSNTITVQAKDSRNNTNQVSIEVFLRTARILSVNPNSGQSGQTLSVTITGENTHFAQGVTQASFGAGIAAGGGQAGAFGPVNVVSPTSATAQLQIGASATPGPRTVTVKTNQEEASLAAGFTVVVISPPTISDFTPKTGPIGTLVTVTGTNFSQGGIAPQVTLNKQGGGTIAAPVSSFTATTLTFVIPAGAATGQLVIEVGGQSATSAEALNVVASSTFDLAAVPGSIDVIRGQSGSFALTLNSNNGFTQLSALSVSGLPSGVTASFKPQQITAGQGSVLTISVPVGQALGATPLTLSAKATVDGLELTSSTTATLNVKPVTTSFLGRTVVADTIETPLAGVTVTFVGKNSNGNPTNCSSQTMSDAAGNFSFTDLPAGCVGEQLIRYDGLTVTAPAGRYAGVDLVYNIVANQVTASPVLVHLPRIDDKETVMVQQNASEDQTFDFKTVPGLSVTVYAGTKFTLVDGTQPNPFPLTAVQVATDRLPDAKPPAPGMVMVFIVAFQPANATASQPVAVYFPNTINTRPGTNMVLMTLDPTKGSMVPYGTGTVANDGSNVIPDLDPAHPGKRYGLVHFDWHGQMPPPPDVNPPSIGGPTNGGAIDLASGLEVFTRSDIAMNGGKGSLALSRTYRTLSNLAGPFGIGTSHNYDYRLDNNTPQGAALLNLVLPDSARVPFVRQANGNLLNSNSPTLRGAVLTTEADGQAHLRFKDGTTYNFAPGNFLTGSVLISIDDPNGNRTTLTRDPSRPARINEVIDPAGRKLVISYDGVDRITSITDPIGRMVRYTYNGVGLLASVTDPANGVTRYEYNAQNNLARVIDPNNTVTYQNTYDANGRVIEQTQADGGKTQYSYTVVNPLAPTSPVIATAVTDPLGNKTTYRFNTQGYVVDVTDPTGQVRVFERQAGTNLLLAMKGPGVCDICGDVTKGDVTFTYDESGNVLTNTDSLGNVTKFTYEPVFNKIETYTDALNNVTRFTYDARSNLTSILDPRGNTTSIAYNAAGQVIQTTDAAGMKTLITYDTVGNITGVTDALGNNQASRFDAVSRLIEQKDALGNRVAMTYDNLDRVISVTDQRNFTRNFTYDAVGNLLTLTDARNKQTTFVYDGMRRVVKRTDPLDRPQSYTYDLKGRLTKVVDRRGQQTTMTYDVINRLVTETFPDASVTRHYNANSRLIEVEDSQGGDFGFVYDSAGRLTRTNTQFGTVDYTRDALGRASSRTVLGQPRQDFTFDPVGNLLTASMPQASATMTYDARNLLQSVMRSNGISTTYTYDKVGRLLSRKHEKANATISSQTYTYDANGRRITNQTDIARPLSTSAAAGQYDDANQLAQFGSRSYTHDANGNRLTETGLGGQTLYTWDGRNRLKSITTPDGRTTNLLYDFTGNLIEQHITGPQEDFTREFVLDETLNVAYQSDNKEQLSFLTGGGIDQHLASIDQDGKARFALIGTLGSVDANIDANGTIEGRAFYEPFGETATEGALYPFEYSGRYRVGESLYYFRARYYDPVAGRFLSEDPLGYLGGNNLYQYAYNDPINHADPTGLWVGLDDALASGIGAIGGLVGQGLTDLISGQVSGWEDYVGSAVGGAVTGEALLYSFNPIVAGAAGGAAGNLTTQGLRNLSGKQCGFDTQKFLFDTGVGGLTGLIPTAKVTGITSGRGSFDAVSKQMYTKLENGTIRRVSVRTAGKMLGADLVGGAFRTEAGSVAQAAYNAANPSLGCK
jgi:RHS repeat-associated protein